VRTPRDAASEPYTNLLPPGAPPDDASSQETETPLNPHFTSIAWKYFKRETEEGPETESAVYGLCRLCLDFKKEAYPYKNTKGSTKSLQIHLMQHIEPNQLSSIFQRCGAQLFWRWQQSGCG
jgi:hypothetical protein